MGCFGSKEKQRDPSTEGQELSQLHRTQSGSRSSRPQTVPVPGASRHGGQARPGLGPTRPGRSTDVDEFIVSAKQATGTAKQPTSVPQASQSYSPAPTGQLHTSQTDPSLSRRRPPNPRPETRTSGYGDPRDRAERPPKKAAALSASTQAAPTMEAASDSSPVTPIEQDPMDEDIPSRSTRDPRKYPAIPKSSYTPAISQGAGATRSTTTAAGSHRAAEVDTRSTSISQYFAPGPSAPFATTGPAYESDGESCSGSDPSEQGDRPATSSRRR